MYHKVWYMWYMWYIVWYIVWYIARDFFMKLSYCPISEISQSANILKYPKKSPKIGYMGYMEYIVLYMMNFLDIFLISHLVNIPKYCKRWLKVSHLSHLY